MPRARVQFQIRWLMTSVAALAVLLHIARWEVPPNSSGRDSVVSFFEILARWKSASYLE